jgi:hypothetical protein
MKALLIISTLIIITSCGHKIHEGEVIKKYYEPPRHYTYQTYIMVGKVMMPQFHTGYDDADFVLVVEGVNGKDTIVEEFYLDEINWECINIGDAFNDTIPCSVDDDGNK